MTLSRPSVRDRQAKGSPAVHDARRSSGRPLDTSARSFVESRFGHDFRQVRVHADARAAQSAEGVGASTFTVGHHVVFDAGQYTPQSAASRIPPTEIAKAVYPGLGGKVKA